MEKKEEADNNREERNNEGKEEREDGRVPQMALNHISRLCRNAKNEDSLPKTDRRLDPMDNHVSFQCEDMKALEQRLKQFNVEYTTRTMDDDKNGTRIDQLFFRDPDGYVIEICNCENLKLVPAGSSGSIKLPFDRHNPPVDLENGHHAK
ncbi:hypothetical protein OIU78_008128 [Salix suchowensis]|nr:hypothetical protein OIU78_008128 [Salix suchowensis]